MAAIGPVVVGVELEVVGVPEPREQVDALREKINAVDGIRAKLKLLEDTREELTSIDLDSLRVVGVPSSGFRTAWHLIPEVAEQVMFVMNCQLLQQIEKAKQELRDAEWEVILLCDRTRGISPIQVTIAQSESFQRFQNWIARCYESLAMPGMILEVPSSNYSGSRHDETIQAYRRRLCRGAIADTQRVGERTRDASSDDTWPAETQSR